MKKVTFLCQENGQHEGGQSVHRQKTDYILLTVMWSNKKTCQHLQYDPETWPKIKIIAQMFIENTKREKIKPIVNCVLEFCQIDSFNS